MGDNGRSLGRGRTRNCWENKSCGREVGGANADELGVCPAARHEAGDACWLLAGTFCGGVVQGTFAEKLGNCMKCAHYQSFDLDHRTRARMRFARFLGRSREALEG